MYSITNHQKAMNDDKNILKLGFFFNKTNAILARNILVYKLRHVIEDFRSTELDNSYIVVPEPVEDIVYVQSVNWIDGLDLSHLPLDHMLPIEQTRSYAEKLAPHMAGILHRASLNT